MSSAIRKWPVYRTTPVCRSTKLAPSRGGNYSSSREYRRRSRGVLVFSVRQMIRMMTRHQLKQVTDFQHRLQRRPRRSRPQVRPRPNRQRHHRSQRRRPSRRAPRPRLRRQRRLNHHPPRLEEVVDRPRPLMVQLRRRPKRRRRRTHRRRRRRTRRRRRRHPNLIRPTVIPRGTACRRTVRPAIEDRPRPGIQRSNTYTSGLDE